MKNMLAVLLVTFTLWAASPAPAASYKIGPDKSKVTFKIMNKAPGSPAPQSVPGSFKDFSGSFHLDPANPTKGSVTMEVKTTSIDTANERRDNHLRSADFFKVKEFPTMTFKSTSFTKINDHSYKVVGDFTLLGKTKPITVTFNTTAPGAGKVMFKIKRSEFGMSFRVPDTADEVDITLDIAGNPS